MEWARLRDGQAAEVPVDYPEIWRYDEAGDWYAKYARVAGQRTFTFAGEYRSREEIVELLEGDGSRALGSRRS